MGFKRFTRVPSHTRNIFDITTLPNLVKSTCRVVLHLKKKLKFDAIAVCGHSGLIIGGAVAAQLGIPLIAVRKDITKVFGDGNMVNMHLDLPTGRPLRYLILDDLIVMGRTIKHIIAEINDVSNDYDSPFTSKCVGVLLHDTYHEKYSFVTVPVFSVRRQCDALDNDPALDKKRITKHHRTRKETSP